MSYWYSSGNATLQSFESGAEKDIIVRTVTGGSLGQNGYIDYRFIVKKTGGDGSTTIRIYFGGTLTFSFSIGASVSDPMLSRFTIQNRGATNSQYCFMVVTRAADETGVAGTATVTAAAESLSIDTTQNQNIRITAQMGGSDDTLHIRGHLALLEGT